MEQKHQRVTRQELRQDILSDTRELLYSAVSGGMIGCFAQEGLPLYFISDQLLACLGYTYGQFLDFTGGSTLACIHPEDRQAALAAMDLGAAPGTEYQATYRMLRPDGGLLWVQDRGRRTQGEDGRVVLVSLRVDVTQAMCLRLQQEEKVRMLTERFRIAMAQTDSTIFDYDIKTRVMLHGDRSAEDYGLLQLTENVPDSLVETGVIHPDTVPQFLEMYRQIRLGVASASCEIRARLAGGGYAWRRIAMTTIYDAQGRPARAVGILEDVTKEKEMELAYLREEQYRSAMLSEAIATYELDMSHNLVLGVDGGWRREFGDPPTFCYDELLELVAARSIWPEDRESYRTAFDRRRLLAAYEQGVTETKLEYRLLADKGPKWVRKTTHLVPEPTTGNLRGFCYIRDIDRQKQEELRLRYQSERDGLTGLYNKAITEERIREILETGEKASCHALLVLDIDAFKNINDHYGHRMGDRVLAESAARLKALFRLSDVLGRIGGDEFIVFLRELRSGSQGVEKAQELCGAFHQLFQLEGQEVKVSCSVGCALFPEDGTTFEDLYQNGDIALYEAKKRGKDQFALFDPAMGGCRWVPYSSTAIDSREEAQE